MSADLELLQQWRTGDNTAVSIPSNGAYLRGTFAWVEGSTAAEGGVDVSVTFSKAGQPATVLVQKARLTLNPGNADTYHNQLLLELPVPEALLGSTVIVTVRLDLAGTPQNVACPYLALTTA